MKILWYDIGPYTIVVYYILSTLGMSTESSDSIAFVIIMSLL
jgi:hypothetical protein